MTWRNPWLPENPPQWSFLQAWVVSWRDSSHTCSAESETVSSHLSECKVLRSQRGPYSSLGSLRAQHRKLDEIPHGKQKMDISRKCIERMLGNSGKQWLGLKAEATVLEIVPQVSRALDCWEAASNTEPSRVHPTPGCYPCAGSSCRQTSASPCSCCPGAHLLVPLALNQGPVKVSLTGGDYVHMESQEQGRPGKSTTSIFCT